MIDVHTHCLPNIDDGAKDVKQSLEMLEESYHQGVDITFATPHCLVHKEADIEEFLSERSKAESLLKEHIATSVPQIILGAEVFLDNDISIYENISRLCIGKTRLMLVEIADGLTIEKTADILYSLSLKGIVPIIAHIDRYPKWREYVRAFGNLKAIYQINTSRFLTHQGRSFIKDFIKTGHSIVVGSDMHNTSTRPCTMGKAFGKAKSKFSDIAEKVFNSEAILLG